ncbi:hypothetical protein DD563_14500 [Pelagicola sp. LXJ1103]|nr:hypothetical protein DD563_14500 [Pelagicola sp. LXJ1103]
MARDFIRLHSNEFRYLLKDTDLFQFVDANLYSQVNNLRRRHETGKLEFQHKELNEKLSAFVADLEVLGLFVAQHTVPELIGGVLRTGFKPCETVTQEEYDQLITLSLEANDLASKAWERLDALVAMIKKSVPEALDIEI